MNHLMILEAGKKNLSSITPFPLPLHWMTLYCCSTSLSTEQHFKLHPQEHNTAQRTHFATVCST